MAAAELDVAQLSAYCSLPQASVTTLLDAPTAELVRQLLANISAKVDEHNECISERLRLGVELENAVRGGESKSRVLKGSIDKGLKDAADLRQRLQLEERTRASVEAELEKFKTETSASDSELSNLRSRIDTLESSNRDTLSLLEAKTTSYDDLSRELNAQHQKTVELKREVSELEQSIQSVNATSISAKFHEQGLQQEIESLKRNNDWLDKELKTKSEEYTRYRKEKSSRIAELQRQYDDAQGTINAANRTEISLRRRLDEVNQKADESLSRIQQLQDESATKEESFALELDAANRLIELTRNSASTERQRQQDLSIQLESVKEDASEQFGKIGAEFETEHNEREAAEARAAELELQIEQLQTNILTLQSQVPGHASPHRAVNGFVHGTPIRDSSTPLDSPGTSRLKGGLSFTQIYSQYNDVKNELDSEKRRNERLSSTLDEMIQDLETRQPEIEDLRVDHIRLEAEIAEISLLVETVSTERDQAVKGVRKWEGQVEAKTREGEVLRQQLRDLSSQIKVLLMEVHLRGQGHDGTSARERAQLERLAQGQIGEVMEGVTDTDRFISENLVTFRNISELQEQNSNLIKITRELGEKMEHEEALRKQTEEARDWEDLQQKYEGCRDEVKSLVTQSQSYLRERDMFRRMLAHRDRLPSGTDSHSLFGESINGDGPPASPHLSGVLDTVESLPSAKDLADYAKMYKEIQMHFDAYRNEAAADRSMLREQLDNLSRSNGELRGEAVRNSSQATLALERYDMLQANYTMLKNENRELQKRSQMLTDSAGKQESRVQQAAEDLVEAKGLVDSMRNENANLKAEKDFWKVIEKRIMEDNENLLKERGRLNVLNTNLQNLANERDHSDAEARRRLQNKVDTLEKELQLTKYKLAEDSEENKRLVQRREYDNKQSQDRINYLMTSLATIRENLTAANTTRDHLSTRVEELTVELRIAEERIVVLQPRPIARLDTSNHAESQQSPQSEDDVNRRQEQEQAVQASELRHEYELTKAELENVKGQVEQYKAISQASEEELASLNETQELYRQEADKLSEERNTRIKELEQRVKDTVSELAFSDSELSKLRNELAENDRLLRNQRTAVEAEIAQLKDQGERHAAAAKYYQQDLKVQAGIAQQAQQNYESELVKHADAAKFLQSIRSEYNDLKLEVVQIKTEADSARTALSQNQGSWAESQHRYEREIAELKIGREDLTAQNNRLHQQLEKVTSQISSLSKRTSEADDNDNDNDRNPESSLENLQEVIKYLRREKEIIDVQLELSVQEGKRLKQQLSYTQSQLDDTRLSLNQQRRIEADNERTHLDHNKLMETINELNTFRESNVTLRAESRQAQTALAGKTAEVERLQIQIKPLQAKIQELVNLCETQEGEMNLLRDNSDRWQQRAQNVLQKYDRIDPADLESLKEQVKALEAERDEIASSKQSLQEQVESSTDQIAKIQNQSNDKWEAQKARLTDQFKGRSKALSDKIKERDIALQTAISEKEKLETRLASLSALESELDATEAHGNAASEKVSTQAHDAKSKTHDGSEEGQVDEGEAFRSRQAELQSLQEKLAQAESRAIEESRQSETLRSQLDTSRSQIVELQTQINQLQGTIKTCNVELSQLRNQLTDLHSSSTAEEQLSKVREELTLAQQDAEDFRARAFVNASLADNRTEDSSRSLSDQVAERVAAARAELEARHNERLRQNDEMLEKRTSAMKTQLTKKLTEGKNQIRETMTADHERLLLALKTDHEQETALLKVKHQDELDELKRGEESRYAEFKEAWTKAAQASQGADGGQTVDQASKGSWQPSEAETKEFLQTNEMARNLLRQNVFKQVNKAREDLSTQLREEYERSSTEQIKEIQAKLNTAKEHAVMMEGKKNSLQINMANNKAKIAQYKVELVQKAAEETPQKPVQEVWLTVKDAKPLPASGPTSQQDHSKLQKIPVTGIFGQSTPLAADPAQAAPATGAFGQPTPVDQTVPSTNFGVQQKLPQISSGLPSSASTFGRPSPAAPTQPKSPLRPQSPQKHQRSGDQAELKHTNNNQNLAQQDPPSQIRLNPFERPSQLTNNNPQAGTGPGALRSLQQSNLPVARGGSTRGNPNIRGRGSGSGRGGPQSLDTARPQGQQQRRGSPGSSGLNAGARQFVPGNKRQREDNQDGQQGADNGNGKRIRGGGGGS